MREHHAASGEVPVDGDALREIWSARRGDQPFPTDPFDGMVYGVTSDDAGHLVLYSSGPDAEPQTDDDLSVSLAGVPYPEDD